MRILYLITKAEMGGAQVHLLDLMRGFRDTVKPIVVTGEEGFFTKETRAMGVPTYVAPHLVHPISPVNDLRGVWEISRLIRSVKADLVHAHTSKAGLLGRLAARATGVPSVFTAHTWCFSEGTSWKWRLAGIPAERMAAYFSSAIINVSEANRRLALGRGIPDRKRMLTIWNGVSDTPHRAQPGAPGVPRITMIARFAEQKDQMTLLRAVAGLESRAVVQFVGDGPTLEAAKAEAARFGISDRVEFLGERSDVAELLSRAQIFALATKWEGFPLTIIEAMRAGLPVVASSVGGISEAVVDGHTGFLAPGGNPDALRHHIRRLVDSPELRASMGLTARGRYEENFTVERMLHQTLAVYRMVLLGVRAAETPAPFSGLVRNVGIDA
jgi:glycosyltransferase involved in cell wall biosynthesis